MAAIVFQSKFPRDVLRYHLFGTHTINVGLSNTSIATSVEDVLARRSRLLFVDAQAAREAAPFVARLMQEEGILQPGLEDFLETCGGYLP